MTIHLDPKMLMPFTLGGGIQDSQAFAYLTPDALMQYCEVRLQGLDTQVNKAFAEQQRANADSQVLSDLTSSLSLGDADLNLDNAGGMETAKAAADQMMAAAQKLQDPQARQALTQKAQAIYDRLNKAITEITANTSWSHGTDAAKLSNSDIDDMFANFEGQHPDASCSSYSISDFKAATSDAVSSIQKDLNSGTELAMINLQSLMSQRQSAIQMCTNLVQSLGDQMNKIAQNIGH